MAAEKKTPKTVHLEIFVGPSYFEAALARHTFSVDCFDNSFKNISSHFSFGAYQHFGLKMQR